jgi:hypothetical protein
LDETGGGGRALHSARGAKTAAAAAAVQAIRPKVDDFFGRCRVAAFDPRALDMLNRNKEEYLQIAAHESDH